MSAGDIRGFLATVVLFLIGFIFHEQILGLVS